MSQTRRETLVAVLQGTNNYSLGELNAMNAIVGTFLTDAEDHGISNTELADRLIAFKKNGGSGLSRAINLLTEEFSTPSAQAACKAAVEQAKAALSQAQAALEAVS